MRITFFDVVGASEVDNVKHFAEKKDRHFGRFLVGLWGMVSICWHNGHCVQEDKRGRQMAQTGFACWVTAATQQAPVGYYQIK